MSNIEVGDYIRTLNGKICKVLSIRAKSRFRTNTGHISNSPERYFVDNLKQYSISKPYVKKHSKNIIDLIEVGDYVNGNKVHSVDYSTSLQTGEKYLVIDKIYQSVKYFCEKDIKSIVTKEMFKEMEYRVDE